MTERVSLQTSDENSKKNTRLRRKSSSTGSMISATKKKGLMCVSSGTPMPKIKPAADVNLEAAEATSERIERSMPFSIGTSVKTMADNLVER